MRRAMLKLLPFLRLTRITGAIAAVGNIWFVILWTRATEEERGTPVSGDTSLTWLLTGGAVAALGLFAYGASLNDILDLRRDRAFHPHRPLPSGNLKLEVAVTLVVCTLIAAILGATIFGTQAVLLTLVLGGAILVFNAAGKFVPAIGLVIVGLIYAGHMGVPNIELRFIWPVWLVMTHALVVACLVHVLERKVPPLSRRALLAAGTGWVFWSGILALIAWRRSGGAGLWPEWVDPKAAIGPGVLVVLFAFVAWHKYRRSGSGPRGAEKISRYGSLWLTLYAAAWLYGQGHVSGGVILTGLAMAGFVAMTFLREVYGLVEQPVGFRRA